MFRSTQRRERRHARPQMEALEDRKLLYATLGANWTYGSRITYSFAPDGTNIGGLPSAMFQTMSNQGYATADWQAAFQKAATTWAVATNINLVLVPDDGSDFGTSSGQQQGDTHFGDIRIGGAALNMGTLATDFLPPPITGGSLAGDMVFNTSQNWNARTGYDLQTVAIHEFGHALGLDHSAITTADMYAYYNGTKQSLTSDDSAGIKAVYGARAIDAFDNTGSPSGNNNYTVASDITGYLNANAQAAIPSLDITNGSDSDWFIVTAPANTSGTLTVTMQSSNLSSLSPKIIVLNGSLGTLATVSAANTYGATVTATISGVTAGQKYYIKCSAAAAGLTSIGAYGLLVNLGSGTMDPIAPPYTVVASQPDQGAQRSLGDRTSTSTNLVQIGALTGVGDTLGISATFAQAMAIVDGTLSTGSLALAPLESFAINLLVGAWHVAERTASAPVVRAAVIQAIDDVLRAWGR